MVTTVPPGTGPMDGEMPVTTAGPGGMLKARLAGGDGAPVVSVTVGVAVNGPAEA